MKVNHLVEQLRRYKLKGEATSTASAADLLTQSDDCLYHVNFGWPCFALSLSGLDLYSESIHLHSTGRITVRSMAPALRWEILAARGTLLRLLLFPHFHSPPLLEKRNRSGALFRRETQNPRTCYGFSFYRVSAEGTRASLLTVFSLR